MSDWYDLKSYIGTDGDNDAVVESCWNDALVLLTQATLNAFRPIPVEIMNRMTLEVGADLFDRSNSPSSGSQFASFDGQSGVPVRAPRDPLSRVRPILSMYVVPF